MKKLTFFLVVVFIGIAALPAFAQKSDVDIFGYYSIVEKYKDFADISEINLAGSEADKEKPPFYGLIRMNKKSAPDYRLLKPTLDGKKLTFKTKTVNNVHYEFDGEFTRLANFPDTRPEAEVLLKGTLTKYRGKIIAAKKVVSFSYSAGD